MDDVRIDATAKTQPSRTAKMVAAVIGGIITLAALAIIGSLAIWALVAIWRGING